MASTKTKTIVGNIFFYLALVIVYGIVVFSIVTKANGGYVSIGGTRTDVVLTDSMAEKNINHLDFLEGTSQIQVNDLVISQVIDDNTELNVKDCVLFKNPDMGNRTVVHRIINIYEEGIQFSVNNCSKDIFGGKEMTSLDPYNGSVVVGSLDLKSIEIVAYSPSEYPLYYQLFFGPNEITLNVETTEESTGVYKHVMTYSRLERTPYKVTIRPANTDEEYIESIKYESFAKGELNYNSSELVVDEDLSYKKHFCPYYLYETRGDSISTADGLFKREALISKVTNVVPFVGVFFRFVQSIPGIVTFIGLGIIITLASYFWTKNEKNKNDNNGETITETASESAEEGTTSTAEVEDEKPDKTDKESS